MRLCTVHVAGRDRLGIVRDDKIHLVPEGPALPATTTELIEGGPEALARVGEASGGEVMAWADADLRAPLRPPRNLFCVGKNYVDHAAEFHGSGFDGSASTVPEHPVFFTKATTSVIGPGEQVRSALDPTGTVDYEGEVAVVIGRGGTGIAEADALDHVFGYTLVNDVTARELQRRHGQWFLGKSPDTFCPMGPVVVTADEVPDVAALRLEVIVNDEVRQQAPLADLIFGIPELIATLSRSMTLLPGDVIATGTPAGVGIGMDPPRYLVPGDVVTVSVAGIGTLRSPIG
ncbi:MAG: fumarylacetoacetate hydrolase family protein [Nocardioidaceae bacterium]|nr:fumarylacetoacetate hydrolase family protein [Nocardioidaceae bacterium]